MLSLVAKFENSEGRNHRWSLKNPNQNKSADEIRTALEKLASLNLFEKNGVGLFKKVISAKFVETIERPIFDIREEVEEAAEVQAAETEAAIQSEAPIIQAAEKLVKTKSVPETAAVQPQAGASQPVITAPQGPEQTGTMEILLPEGDVADMSEEELLAFIMAQLPEGAVLEDFHLEQVEVPVAGVPIEPNTSESDSAKSVASQQKSTNGRIDLNDPSLSKRARRKLWKQINKGRRKKR